LSNTVKPEGDELPLPDWMSPTNEVVPSVAIFQSSKPWLLRYAGNELAGIKISTGYRIMNNTIGLKLVASTNAPGADIS
jgi:hypothetical protein